LPMKTMVDAELHEGGSTSFTLVILPVDKVRAPDGDGVTHVRNIFSGGYEFEGDGPAIS
jgi:hypothetical protein